MIGSILWDTDNDCEASNWDGTAPFVDGEFVYVKELGCSCDPSQGSVCGGCEDRTKVYVIGKQYVWKPNLTQGKE